MTKTTNKYSPEVGECVGKLKGIGTNTLKNHIVMRKILVPKAGLEPARPKAGDFESPASTIPPLGHGPNC